MKQGIEIEILKQEELGRLKTVLEEDRFDPYRKYKMAPAPKRVEYRLARLAKDQASDADHNFTIEISEDRPAAFAAVKRHALASETFGLTMGQIEISIGRGGECHLDDLLEAAVSEARERGFQHLAISIDGSDIALLGAAQGKGFFLTAAQIMFLYFFRPAHPLKAIDRHSVRKYTSRDYEQVLEIARDSFGHNMRFHRDPYLDHGQIPQFYLKWLEHLIRESRGQFAYVSCLGNETTGFLFGRFDPLFYETTGVRKLGEGLSGVGERGKGSYPALWAGALKGLENDVDIFEAQCLLENTEVIRTLTAFDFQLVRSQYVMHRYLGEKE